MSSKRRRKFNSALPNADEVDTLFETRAALEAVLPPVLAELVSSYDGHRAHSAVEHRLRRLNRQVYWSSRTPDKLRELFASYNTWVTRCGCFACAEALRTAGFEFMEGVANYDAEECAWLASVRESLQRFGLSVAREIVYTDCYTDKLEDPPGLREVTGTGWMANHDVHFVLLADFEEWSNFLIGARLYKSDDVYHCPEIAKLEEWVQWMDDATDAKMIRGRERARLKART